MRWNVKGLFLKNEKKYQEKEKTLPVIDCFLIQFLGKNE